MDYRDRHKLLRAWLRDEGLTGLVHHRLPTPDPSNPAVVFGRNLRDQERFFAGSTYPHAGALVFFSSGWRWAQVTSDPFVLVKPVSIGPDQAGFH